MKTTILIVVLLFASIALCCSDNIDCTESDSPICESGTCVECTGTSHCDKDKYCDLDKNKCISYSDDNKYGEFCHTEDCSVYETNEVCGKCEQDDSDNWVKVWQGVCYRNKCYPCKVGTDDMGDQLTQHIGVECKPTGVSGIEGKVVYQQQGSARPKDLQQSSLSIAYFVIGFFFFFFVCVQCLIVMKLGK
ncbi:hypothetical protein M0813_03159 [Anaeramoeba flamelloides]|uniref:Uncharacterized protein n=1 Tax=Anaeramoeba flamelloides TaxID=1746091 RepID=A0ABQ8Y3Q2_9EUKA|nr:hypothetical protein M0813_03159 [Anaeramoeba flamelloides]